MRKDLEILELDPDASRQYVDARAAFTALETARKALQEVRGGMVWKSVRGTSYLIRTSASGGQKSLGRHSPETDALYAKFTAKKALAAERHAALKAAVTRHERMNRALRVGRMPNIAVEILGRLASAQIDSCFRVVGTHALFAYEAAAGVSLSATVTSTRDIDLLWDTRRRVTFAERLARDAPSMLAALQKADKSFALREDQKYTAVNADGFEVDIIRREAEGEDPHPVRLSDAEDDFWVVQARRAADLLNAREFSEVVVATNGVMARLTTIHPKVFVEFKRWMAQQGDRDPVKRRRDALQAEVVQWLLDERLPQL